MPMFAVAEARPEVTTRLSLRLARFAPLAILLALFVYLLVLGASVGWLPWPVECSTDHACFPGPGESLASEMPARNYIVDGARFWFVQRDSASADPDSLLLYTHNMSVGALLFYVLESLILTPRALNWVPDIAFQMSVVVTILGFCAGLYYAYLFVKRASGSQMLALIFLVALSVEYYFNLLFAFNLIRGWHWLAYFGSAYHLLVFVQEQRWGHYVAFAVFTILGFTIGYDFLTFCFFLSVLIVILFARARRLRALLLTAVGYVVPFVLRQIQIIGALGFDFWIHDVYYSAVIKTSFLSNFFPLPPIPSIDAWYLQHRVERPYAVPDTNLGNLARGVSTYAVEQWLPYLGTATTAFVVVGMVLAAAVIVATSRRTEVGPLARAAKLVLAVALADALGLYFFAPLSVEIYMHHRFPMLIAGILLAFAFLVYAVGREMARDRARPSWSSNAWVRVGLAAVLMLVVVGRAVDLSTSARSIVLAPPSVVATLH